MFAHGVGGAGDEYRRDMLNMMYGMCEFICTKCDVTHATASCDAGASLHLLPDGLFYLM